MVCAAVVEGAEAEELTAELGTAGAGVAAAKGTRFELAGITGGAGAGAAAPKGTRVGPGGGTDVDPAARVNKWTGHAIVRFE